MTAHLERPRRRSSARLALIAAAASLVATSAFAIDIVGVESAALDQPRINAYVSLTAGGAPITASGAGVDSFNIQAFYDTGASGILLSNNTAGLLGLQTETVNGQDVIFSDVGVAGSDDFFVSKPLYISLADYHPNRDVDNSASYSTVYKATYGPVRTQIGPANAEPDPVLGDLDVFGMPTLAGRVMVMDPKPVNTFLDTMRTYTYAPGTPFNASAAASNPGIPEVDKHVKLSYVSFDRFTEVSPSGAPGPSLRNNPFIGPNPFVPTGTDSTPPVTLSFGGNTTTGSFLLDTGAAASMISSGKASALGVTYDPNTQDTDHPTLLFNGQPIDNQFELTIGGIGGSKTVAGFYLSSLLLKTEEGNAANDNDPNHLRFLDAPVLVADISVQNPDVPSDRFTLDGIFGMNFLVATAQIAGVDANGFPLITNLASGKFDWITFDEPAGKLGLKLAAPVDPNELRWLGDLFGGTSYWDTVSPNWNQGGNLVLYEDGNQVIFDDASISSVIRLNEVVLPVRR